jgi:hypothetical protein
MPICVFMCPYKDEPGGKDWVQNYIISVKLEFLSNFNERKAQLKYWLGHTKISSMHYSKSNPTLVHL